MDLYCLYSTIDGVRLSTNDLYLIGITGIHIAIKAEESYRFSLDKIVKEIGHNSYSKE